MLPGTLHNKLHGLRPYNFWEQNVQASTRTASEFLGYTDWQTGRKLSPTVRELLVFTLLLFLRLAQTSLRAAFILSSPSHPMPLAHVCQAPRSCTGQEEHMQVAGSHQGQAHLLVTTLILEGPEGHLCYGFVGKERAALLKVFTFPKSCGERQLRSMANSP